jgi:hypothetical protein
MPRSPLRAPVFASLLALMLATPGNSASNAAQDCLTEPNLQAGGAGRWHYRLDRATKQKCWYLRPAGTKPAQASPKTQPPPIPVPRPPAATPAAFASTARGEVAAPEQQPLRWPDPPRLVATDDFTPRPAATETVSLGDRGADEAPSLRDDLPAVPSVPAAAEPTTASLGKEVALLAVALWFAALAAGAIFILWLMGQRARGHAVNYYSVLRRAVADLDPHDGEARRAVCDRARRLLIDHLRNADPPLRELAIRAEQSALEAAIRRIESQSRDSFYPLAWWERMAAEVRGLMESLRKIPLIAFSPVHLSEAGARRSEA